MPSYAPTPTPNKGCQRGLVEGRSEGRGQRSACGVRRALSVNKPSEPGCPANHLPPPLLARAAITGPPLTGFVKAVEWAPLLPLRFDYSVCVLSHCDPSLSVSRSLAEVDIDLLNFAVCSRLKTSSVSLWTEDEWRIWITSLLLQEHGVKKTLLLSTPVSLFLCFSFVFFLSLSLSMC